MAKVNVEVISGVVDGKKKGAKLSVEEKSAKALEAKGFVKIVASPKAKPKPAKKESAPKKQSKATKVKTVEAPAKEKATTKDGGKANEKE